MHKAMSKVLRSEDRIGGLPDTVLAHILSFVTTKESVRTSILSKRWLSVWSYVPVLDLDDSSLSGTDSNKDQAIHSSFIQFLNNVFNLYNAGSLQKLTLKCSKFDRYRVNEWVMAAMKHRVPHLDLCITIEHFSIGVPLFAYQDLVDLKLGNDFVLDIPGEVLLPCLKKLHLDSVRFSNDESCHKLLRGCPVLEHLDLDSCPMHNIKTLEITAPKLKILDIQSDHVPDNYDHQVVVDAPSLKVLMYTCFMAKGYSFKNLNSLATAYIDVDVKHVDRSKVSNIRKIALQLVNGIANAEVITLGGYSLELLSFLDPTELPIFNKCTYLVLGCNKYCGTLLLKLLENSPCLRTLIFDQEIANEEELGEYVWHKPTQEPECLCSLELVEIHGYRGQRGMSLLAGHLMMYSIVFDDDFKACKPPLSIYYAV